MVRIATRANLMPLSPTTTRSSGRSLAKFLKDRDDVDQTNLEIRTYVMTDMAMGIVLTLMWAAEALQRRRVRAEVAQSSTRCW